MWRPGPPLAGVFFCAALAAGAEEIAPGDAGALTADVVILGEVHDNPVHHRTQADAVAGLRPAALVFEMFGPAEALAAERADRTDAAALEAGLGWTASGWPDFAMYHPIFLAAPEARIFGGAVDDMGVRRAAREGAAAAIGPSAALFGLDRPLPADEQAVREAGQADAHCGALPGEMLPGMVEVQRLRDAAMARAVVAAMAETGGPVALITGNGHARTDWGVPRFLARALPDASVLSLGQLEGPPAAAPPYDVWTVTGAPERGDPCAVFRQRD